MNLPTERQTALGETQLCWDDKAAGMGSIVVKMLALVLVFGCGQSRPQARTYDLEGEVVAVAANHSSVTVAHKEIPGYMAAMTMPFPVKEPKLLEGVAAGDLIRGQLTVTDTAGWLSELRVVGKAPARPPPDPSKALPIEHLLQPGEDVPEIALANQAGQPVRMRDFLGEVVVVNFIYTRCPFPNFCPWQSNRIVELRRALAERLPRQVGRVRFLSISIDPAYDTPAVLRAYGARYGADFERWTFATGSVAEIAKFGAALGCSFWNEEGILTHNLVTAIIRADGKLHRAFRGNEWSVEEFMQALKAALS